jgi:hypothetical protein
MEIGGIFVIALKGEAFKVIRGRKVGETVVKNWTIPNIPGKNFRFIPMDGE